MHTLQRIQEGPQRRAQPLIRHIRRREDGIAAYLGPLQQTQHDIARRLDLVADILVPEGGRGALLEEAGDFVAVAVAVDNVEGGVIADGTRDRLIVGFAEVAHEGFLRGGAVVDQVLIWEGEDFALGDEQGEFVLSGVGEPVELEAFDDGADGWLDVGDGYAGGEEGAHGGIFDAQGRVDVVERGEGVEPDGIPGGEVLRVGGVDVREFVDVSVGDVDVVADGDFGFMGVVGVVGVAIGLGTDEGG